MRLSAVFSTNTFTWTLIFSSCSFIKNKMTNVSLNIVSSRLHGKRLTAADFCCRTMTLRPKSSSLLGLLSHAQFSILQEITCLQTGTSLVVIKALIYKTYRENCTTMIQMFGPNQWRDINDLNWFDLIFWDISAYMCVTVYAQIRTILKTNKNG